MEYGIIEREIHIDATPEVVFEVISSPEHVKEWWSDEADFDATPGAVGELTWNERAHVASITIVEAEPHHRFSFRWVTDEGQAATATNSLLVTFDLSPTSTGTTLHLTETGFRERGWEAAVLEETYLDHCNGWDQCVARLGEYVTKLVATP